MLVIDDSNEVLRVDEPNYDVYKLYPMCVGLRSVAVPHPLGLPL